MSLRILKEHLPWIAPTTAIVLAATGVISFGPRDAAPVDMSSDFEVSRTLTQNPVAVGEQGIGLLPEPSGSIEALQAVVQQVPQVPDVTLAPVPVEPAIVTSAQPQVAPQPVSIEPAPTLSPTTDPSAFFSAAQANLAQDKTCVEDLRVLANDARVYFPSGGLTADEAGMAQARLIGLVAQNCPHVEIVVQGHSDPSGDPAANLRLSQERADAVLNRIAASGIDIARFSAVGLGSQEPSRVTGSQPAAYYDRRVEFEIRDASPRAAQSVFSRPEPAAPSACAAELQAAVAQTRLFYSPRSITAPSDGMPAVFDLAAKASACPDARLRVVGQFSDDPGLGETPTTARLRAVALMSSLVAAGFDPEQIIIASHSRPQVLAGQPGLSEQRVDFDVILEN